MMSLIECPYVEGAKFVLDFKPGTVLDKPFKSSSKLETTVLRTFNPFTISPVLKIRVDRSDQETSAPASSILVLKLFDSHFATDLRKWHDVPDLTSTLVKEYHEFSQRQSKTFGEWDAKRIDLENENKELSPLEKEAHLDTALRSFYQRETQVYEKLIELQGRAIPIFFGQTRFAINLSSHPSLEPDVPGVLLEFIEGQNLEDLALESFREAIATSALDVISTLSNKEILNKDVRLTNFIVPSSDLGRPVVMIDFAQCTFRGEESDKEWYDKKAHQDEEGALAYPLQQKVGWKYRPSYRYVIREE